MKKTLCYFTLLLCHWLFAATAAAEVYKWTDKDGKLHYGDKKTAKTAEDITASLSKPNIDTSSGEHKKLETLFRKENAADRAYKAEQAMPNPAQEDHAQRCSKARERLKILEGRVVFIDQQGKPVRTSEEERERRAGEMRKILAENCGS